MSNRSEAQKQRLYARVEYQKVERLRFLGHRDLATTWDRAVRRAELPVAYTEGFHPRAKISFAPPLPVGMTGLHELCGIELREPLVPMQISKRLGAQLPSGLDLLSVRVLARPRRSLFADLSTADYAVVVNPGEVDAAELAQAVGRFVAADNLVVERVTKHRIRRIDIRPGTRHLSVATNGMPHLQMSLSLDPDNLVKPAEVLQVLAKLMARDNLPIAQMIRIALY